MSPSRSLPSPSLAGGRRLTLAAAAFLAIGAAFLACGESRVQAQNPPILIPLTDDGGNDIVDVYACSNDGSVAIGASSFRPNPPYLFNEPPQPRDALFVDELGVGDWNLPIEDLRYMTVDETTNALDVIHFPTDQLVGHLVTSVVLPRDSSARLVFINTSIVEGGTTKYDAWVWYVDYTEDPDPTRTDVVRVGSDLDLKCCSSDGRLAYCDDNARRTSFWRCERIGDQYSVTRIGIGQNSRGVPANEDISDPYESVDCCSADGMIVYGRQYDYFWYRNNNEIGTYRGYYTFTYDDSTRNLIVEGASPEQDRVLICTDDGALAIAAGQSNGYYDAWNPQLNLFSGSPPGATRYFPLAIRNNQQAFGHITYFNGDTAPVTSDAPRSEFTVLKLLAGDTRGREIVADQTVSRVLGYSIRVGTPDVETLVRWTPALSSVELLDDVYATDGIQTIFAASRDIKRLYCIVNDGVNPASSFRITQPVDTPPYPLGGKAIVGTLGDTLTMEFSEAVTLNTPPVLNLSGGPTNATLMGGDGTSVLTFSLDRVVQFGETGTYDLAAGAVTDFGLIDNNAVVGFGINNQSQVGAPPPDVTPPTITSAVIDADGDTFTLVFSESVNHVKLPFLAGPGGAITASAPQGSGTNAISYSLSRVVYEGQTFIYSMPTGGVVDLAGNPIAQVKDAQILNQSDVQDPTIPPPPPPEPPVTSQYRELGAYANYYCDQAFNTSANFYLDPAGYTENAYYAYLTAYYAVLYRYYAGDTIRWGGGTGKTKEQARQEYMDLRYQQALMSYYSLSFAVEDYNRTYSNTSLYVFLYSYYAFDYASQDLSAP